MSMNVMDKLLDVIKLRDEENEDYYDDDYMDEEDEEDEKIQSIKQAEAETAPSKRSSARVTPISRPQPRKVNNATFEVCMIKPTSVEDAREITDTLLAGMAVVLNLEGIGVDLAQRIIDFASGSCFAVRGSLQKISQYIFLIAPREVEISGDFQEILNDNFDVPSI